MSSVRRANGEWRNNLYREILHMSHSPMWDSSDHSQNIAAINSLGKVRPVRGKLLGIGMGGLPMVS